jgi:hypothetical protein
MGNQNGQGKADRRQGPVHLEHIEAIEKRLWNAADTLRSNSNYASNEYFMPVNEANRLLSLRNCSISGTRAALPPRQGWKAHGRRSGSRHPE